MLKIVITSVEYLKSGSAVIELTTIGIEIINGYNPRYSESKLPTFTYSSSAFFEIRFAPVIFA